MGLVGRVLSFLQTTRLGAQVSDTKLEWGDRAPVTAEHFGPPGDDSHPLPGDYVRADAVPQTGRTAVTGYIDPVNAPKAEAGERRIYSRNSAGAVVAEFHLKNDGSVALVSTGNVTINGVTITPAGDVVIPSSLVLNGKEIAEHTHSQAVDSDGDTQQDTGPNN